MERNDGSSQCMSNERPSSPLPDSTRGKFNLPPELDDTVELSSDHQHFRNESASFPFLSLPLAVRRQIYQMPLAKQAHYLDGHLFTSCLIELSGRPSRIYRTPRSLPDDNFSCYKLPRLHSLHSLLLTCRQIYAEVSKVVYSMNQFFVDFHREKSLQPLRNLSGMSLANLRHLTIHLSVSTCQLEGLCEGAFRPRYKKDERSYDKPLSKNIQEHRDIIADWKRTIEHIAPCITSSKLKLFIVCDVQDHETASAVVEPLSLLGKLARCDIRLGAQSEPVLREMARVTSLQATGSIEHEKTSPFPFLRLPREIRHHVLQYTDLITPHCNVEWSPKGYRFRNFLGSTLDCEFWYDYNSRPEAPSSYCWLKDIIGCFCLRYHSAFSMNCQCWSPPTALFLVCRSMLEDARDVFFSENRFTVMPEGDFELPVPVAPDRLEASIFLREIVPEAALHRIKFLEFVFPPFEEKYLWIEHPAFPDWREALAYAKQKMNIQQLTLRVHMVEMMQIHNRGAEYRGKMNIDKALAIVRSYKAVICPLKTLKDMKRFYVRAAWPYAWNRGWAFRMKKGLLQEEEERRKMETTIEQKWVMGTDYDSDLMRNEEPSPSTWYEVFDFMQFRYC